MTSGPKNKPLAIYDTGLVLQATLSPSGVAERALLQVELGVVDAIMSNRLRSEYEDVLHRFTERGKYKRILDLDVVEAQLERVDALIRLVPNAPEQIEYRRDPDDAPTINLAIYYDVDFVIARDKDLLVLNNDPVLKKRSPNIRIVDPLTFLQIIAVAAARTP